MDKRKDAIPEHFNSDEEAGKFWDTHSAADYWTEMQETEMEFDIQKRTFLVPVEERIYRLARKRAKTKHRTVRQVVNSLLSRELAGVK